jgi:hypothetical protein
MLHKIQIVNKRYDINYSESKTLQHYVTLPHLLFCAQKHYHISTQLNIYDLTHLHTI